MLLAGREGRVAVKRAGPKASAWEGASQVLVPQVVALVAQTAATVAAMWETSQPVVETKATDVERMAAAIRADEKVAVVRVELDCRAVCAFANEVHS